MEYEVPSHIIDGAEVAEYGPPEYSSVSDAFHEGFRKVQQRQGNRGIVIICNGNIGELSPDDREDIARVYHQIKENSIFYIKDNFADMLGVTNATEEEIKIWLRDRPKTNLLINLTYAKGWEDSTMVVMDTGHASDNMTMRVVCNLIKIKVKDICDYRKKKF